MARRTASQSEPETQPVLAGRVQPQNLEAEDSVLGSLLLDSDAMLRVADLLRPDDFYHPAHAAIYEAMLSLYEKRTPIDLVTISDELTSRKELEMVGGAAKLSSLVSAVATATNIQHYAGIVRQKALLRRLISAASKIGDLGFQEDRTAEEVMDEAESTLFNVTQRYLKQNFVSIRSVLDESFERLGLLANQAGAVRGIPTGFKQLDHLMGGLQRSDLIIIAARPSMGKTTFAMNIAEQVAAEDKVVGIFSLEMSKEQLVDRLVSSIGRVDSWKLRNGQLNDADMSNLIQAQAQLAETKLFIDDAGMASVMEVRTKARRLQAEHGLDLLVVDYLQLLTGSIRSNQDNRVQEVSEISRSLKALAKELNIPIVALSQLSRAVESRTDKRPMLSDLRESGCLSADTLITRADTGERLQISKLVGQSNIPVWSLDQNQKLVPVMISKVFSSGFKQTFRLRLRSGRTIKASGNHPFRLYDGWARLDKLKIKDRVAVPRVLPSVHADFGAYTSDHLAFLAHMIGDGCFVPNQPVHYTTADVDNAQTVARAAHNLFGIAARVVRQENWLHVYLPSPYQTARNKRHPFRIWLESQGLQPAHSYDKKLPDNLFKCSDAQISYFLHHLWATDGCLSFKSQSIYYATTSLVLARQVQHLLLRLGIQGVVRQTTLKPGTRQGYVVDIQGKLGQTAFLEQVGCAGARGNTADSFYQILDARVHNPNLGGFDQSIWSRVVIPAKEASGRSWRQVQADIGTAYCGSTLFKSGLSPQRLEKIATAVKDQRLLELARADLYWDEVVEITPLLQEEVFDATVPGTHNFVANDIIVHNSIEQDSDVVMFLYREDYYNKNKEEHNHLVDVIVSKHRNGPTGEIKLSSQFQYSRFFDVDVRHLRQT